MKIGVISDTHIPRIANALPEIVAQTFRDVELILHAGDFEIFSVIDDLEAIAPVLAVSGNMDREQRPELAPEKRIVEIAGRRIGLIHGWGAPGGLHLKLRKEFDDSVDRIVFGHTHQAFNEKVNGVLMFNPGSPTDKRFAPYRSLGIMTLDEGPIKTEIIKIS